MNTKPINDTLDRTIDRSAIEVNTRTALGESSDAAADRPGPAMLHPVEAQASEVATPTDEESASPDATDPAAKKRVERFEFLPHRFAGRRVLPRRRR